MSCFLAVLRRDVRLALCHKSALLPGPAFFALMIILFPLALGPDDALLQITAPAILALAALLASLFPLERLFLSDQEDGSLDLLLSFRHSLFGYVCGKLAAHWIFGGLLLVGASSTRRTPSGRVWTPRFVNVESSQTCIP